MPTRLRDQRGQTALEYLGIITAVAAMLVVIIAASPRIGQTIACGIDGQISKLTGGGSSLDCGEIRGEPTEPCVISDSSGQLKASITAFSIKGGGEVKLLRETLSDDTVRVTVSGGANLGLQGKLGASGGIDVGNFSATEGASATGSVSLKGEGGGIWEFGSAAEADEFVEIVRNRARDGAIESVAPGIGHLATWALGEDRPIPPPKYTYVQGGVGATGSAEAGAGTAYANAGLDASQVVGARVNNENGEKTIFYTLKGSGDLNAGVLIGAGAQGDLEGTLAVTVDKNGRPLQAQVVGKGAVAATDLNGQLTGLNPKKLLEKFKGKGSDQEGYRGEIRGTLDLTDPANAAAFDNLLDNPLTGVDDLARRFQDDATWDARVYEFDRDKYGGDASFGAVLAFGIEGGYEGVDSTLKGAWYWGPNSGGIQPWVSCT